jgi:hypothetical protein
LDVNNDGAVSPLDALLVINELPSTSRAPSAAGLPTSLASSFAVDRVAGPTRLFRRLSTAEAESEPDQVNLSESETSIHATTRHARVDAAVRAVPQAGNLAASQLDSHWRKGKAVETMDDVFAAW